MAYLKSSGRLEAAVDVAAARLPRSTELVRANSLALNGREQERMAAMSKWMRLERPNRKDGQDKFQQLRQRKVRGLIFEGPAILIVDENKLLRPRGLTELRGEMERVACGLLITIDGAGSFFASFGSILLLSTSSLA